MGKNLEWLVELALPADVELIANFGPPDERIENAGKAEEIFPVLAHLRELLVSLTSLDGDVTQLVGNSNSRDGDALFWKVFGKLATYFACLARSAASEDPAEFCNWMCDGDRCASPRFRVGQGKELRDELNVVLASTEGSSEEREQKAAKIKSQMNCARAALTAGLQIFAIDRSLLPLALLHTMQKLSENEADLVDSEVEAEALAGLLHLNDGIGRLGGSLSQSLSIVIREVMTYGEFVYRERGKQQAAHSIESAFSMQWLGELDQLSKRGAAVSEKYGAKQVERRFERHLALLFQTFGFVTIPALSGEPAADLLCIGKDGSTGFTVLIDAKSSKRPYVLPKSDQRALLDYVRETVRTLADLPPLRLALIVGNGPANTVEDKLARLEVEANLPLRFVTAEDLATFRKQHDGLVRLDLLLDMLLNGEKVLQTKDWEELLSRHEDLQNTYSEFVRSMRSLSGG